MVDILRLINRNREKDDRAPQPSLERKAPRLSATLNGRHLFLSAKFTFMDFREIGGRRMRREDNRREERERERDRVEHNKTDLPDRHSTVLATTGTVSELFTHTHTHQSPFLLLR